MAKFINVFVVSSSDMSCFQGLFFCPEAASLLLHNFCIYHISPPGHEVQYFSFSFFNLPYALLDVITYSMTSLFSCS
jgi:hypothetical protein